MLSPVCVRVGARSSDTTRRGPRSGLLRLGSRGFHLYEQMVSESPTGFAIEDVTKSYENDMSRRPGKNHRCLTPVVMRCLLKEYRRIRQTYPEMSKL